MKNPSILESSKSRFRQWRLQDFNSKSSDEYDMSERKPIHPMTKTSKN